MEWGVIIFGWIELYYKDDCRMAVGINIEENGFAAWKLGRVSGIMTWI